MASAGLSKQASSCSSLPSATASRVALSSARVASGRPSYATAMTFGGASVVPGGTVSTGHGAPCRSPAAIDPATRRSSPSRWVRPTASRLAPRSTARLCSACAGSPDSRHALVDALGVQRLEQRLPLPAQLLVELDARGHPDVGVHRRHLRVHVRRDHLRALGAGKRDGGVDRGAGIRRCRRSRRCRARLTGGAPHGSQNGHDAVLWPDCLSLVRSTRLARRRFRWPTLLRPSRRPSRTGRPGRLVNGPAVPRVTPRAMSAPAPPRRRRAPAHRRATGAPPTTCRSGRSTCSTTRCCASRCGPSTSSRGCSATGARRPGSTSSTRT